MSKTKIVCSNCGAEFAIPETTHVAVGIAIGADSNLGVIHPTVVGQCTPSQREDINPISNHRNMKTEAKLEALRKAGVNVDNLFSMKGATGQEILARMKDGKLEVVPDNDPIFAAIIQNGTVNSPKLFRRWVMAQVFHMLATGDFVRALQHKGYAYQWKMLIEELRVQTKLFHKDLGNFAERNRFFDRDRAVKMAHDYIDKLREHVKKMPRKRCKGVPYVTIKSKNIFVEDVPSKVYRPLLHLAAKISYAKNPFALYQAVIDFYKGICRVWMAYDIPMSADFKDSYKGAGAFFTMKNMILFHSCKFRAENGRFISREASMSQLYTKAEEYSTEGWRLFGVMKKLIRDNGIDIRQKMAEWRK